MIQDEQQKARRLDFMVPSLHCKVELSSASYCLKILPASSEIRPC